LSRRSGGTQDLKAHGLYLRAVASLNQNTKMSLAASESYAKQAIEVDPTYGLAWSTLALAVMTQADNGWIPITEGYRQARQLALNTLKLSPDLAEAQATVAYTYFILDWNWSAAQAEAEKAIAINPRDPWALQTMGIIHSTLGHWDEAVRQLRAGLASDPLNTFSILNLGNAYYGAGRYSEAEKEYRKLLELEPDFLWTRRWLSKTLLALGQPEVALTVIQQEADEANRLALLPVMLYAVGRKAEGDEALNGLITRWGDTWPFYVAQAYAYKGDHDRALDWLERAYKMNDVGLSAIVGEPLFNSMADDPRFKAFLRKMNLPERW
jgi:tetratricopeptide (TPR) repeat protein